MLKNNKINKQIKITKSRPSLLDTYHYFYGHRKSVISEGEEELLRKGKECKK